MEGENEKMFNSLLYHILDQRGCVRTILWKRKFSQKSSRRSSQANRWQVLW